ncbi:hypothetical protein ACWIGI_09325 [Nocardia sp. NPDC055321]
MTGHRGRGEPPSREISAEFGDPECGDQVLTRVLLTANGGEDLFRPEPIAFGVLGPIAASEALRDLAHLAG